VTIITNCRFCSREFEPDAAAIRGGTWRVCPECETERGRPLHPIGGRCQKCQKPLRDKRQYICLSCASISVA
jgi:hypothetical protein